MRKQKGITLVALVITIIVMLILVGVTVNVSLNGELFELARKASNNTTKESEKEQLLESVITAYYVENGNIDKEKLQKELGDEWTVSSTTGELPYKVISPNNNKYIVNKDKTISEPIELPEGLEEGDEINIDADGDGTEETWIVLYHGKNSYDHLAEDEIEVISKNAMGSLTLGKDDEVAKKYAKDLDGNREIEDIEVAIYSYNNAIDRINNYCNSLIKIDNLGVRSVGSDPSDPYYKNEEIYEPDNLDEWEDTTAWERYGKGNILAGEPKYYTDRDQMSKIDYELSDLTR